jgi:hypothetical protein
LKFQFVAGFAAALSLAAFPALAQTKVQEGTEFPLRLAQGDHRTGTQVVTVVLVGVFAGFVKGKNVTIPKGTQFVGYADQDTVLEGPIAPPPADV